MQIKTLVQLEEEKKKLTMEIEVSKRAFIHSFGTTQTQAKNFFLKKVALPATTIGLATMGVKKMVGNSNSSKHYVNNRKTFFLLKLLPLVIPVAQSFLAKSKYFQVLPTFVQELIISEQLKKANSTK